MSVNRRLLGAGALLALTLVPATAQAATKSVFAGPPKPIKGAPEYADINAYFPSSIKVAKGDEVEFNFRGFHDVYFPKRGKRAPGLETTDGQKVSGVNDAAGNPFWFNGQNRVIANPAVLGPSGDAKINGKAADGSGLPLEPNTPPFEARFPKPGTYRYFCNVHPGMKGKVSVTSSRKGVPSAAKDKARVARQVARIAKTVKRLDAFEAPAEKNTVRAGNDTIAVALFKFFPQSLTIKAGEAVTFEMPARTAEIHTASFGPADYLNAQSDAFIAPDPASPAGGPPTVVFNPIAAFPSDPPPTLPPFTGTNHGNGFINTGVLDRIAASPPPAESRITFQTPGTYGYICLVHGKDMGGTVTVTS